MAHEYIQLGHGQQHTPAIDEWLAIVNAKLHEAVEKSRLELALYGSTTIGEWTFKQEVRRRTDGEREVLELCVVRKVG